MNLNINKFWKKRSITITEYDPTYKVVYLGNVLTAWAKGEGCVDKPLATLWKNYCQNVKPDVYMKVTVCNSGLKAVTKEHGLTEYWSHRITFCGAHAQYPRVFCWVYRHEGKKLRQELRCHAVLCSKEEMSRRMAGQLQQKLAQALQEFKREKICRQNARLSLANSVYDNPSLPRRKILLSTGSVNYRPPLERSKSAPKLMVIEEAGELGEGLDDEVKERRQQQFSQLLEERLMLHQRRQQRLRLIASVEEDEEIDDKDDNEIADLDDVILMDPILEQDTIYQEDEEECDEGLMSETYNTNPMATSRTGSAIGMDDNDDLTPTPPSSTSTSSSPSSVREGRLRKNSKNEEDNISDESGYSEDNGVHAMAGRTYTCNV